MRPRDSELILTFSRRLLQPERPENASQLAGGATTVHFASAFSVSTVNSAHCFLTLFGSVFRSVAQFLWRDPETIRPSNPGQCVPGFAENSGHSSLGRTTRENHVSPPLATAEALPFSVAFDEGDSGLTSRRTIGTTAAQKGQLD